jgi:hypothetical protein
MRRYRCLACNFIVCLPGIPRRRCLRWENLFRAGHKKSATFSLLLGNLPRDQFLTLLSRSFICLRDNIAKMVDWGLPESSSSGLKNRA